VQLHQMLVDSHCAPSQSTHRRCVWQLLLQLPSPTRKRRAAQSRIAPRSSDQSDTSAVADAPHGNGANAPVRGVQSEEGSRVGARKECCWQFTASAHFGRDRQFTAGSQTRDACSYRGSSAAQNKKQMFKCYCSCLQLLSRLHDRSALRQSQALCGSRTSTTRKQVAETIAS
jgi:hypothetical protein